MAEGQQPYSRPMDSKLLARRGSGPCGRSEGNVSVSLGLSVNDQATEFDLRLERPPE
jgi:hypothetical protein